MTWGARVGFSNGWYKHTAVLPLPYLFAIACSLPVAFWQA